MPAAARVSKIFTAQRGLGLGAVPLGNEFRRVTDRVADETLEAAWDAGIRYYDVSPWYGLGLAERRLGRLLHNQQRDDYVLSTKVGKLLKASKVNRHAELFPLSDSPNDVFFDYSADGVRRSIEDSLQRLGVDSIDVVFVHDLSPDNSYLPTGWEEEFEIAQCGAFPALTQMREEGIIKAWGLGVNRPEPILRAMEVADLDVCLCASQYSLIDHARCVHELLPAVRARGVSFVMGSALNAGFLSGSARYNYGPDNTTIPSAAIEKRERLAAVAKRHGVDLRTAALQFAAAVDVAVSVVVGARSQEQVIDNYTSMHTKTPSAFWEELKATGLVEQGAAVPG